MTASTRHGPGNGCGRGVSRKTRLIPALSARPTKKQRCRDRRGWGCGGGFRFISVPSDHGDDYTLDLHFFLGEVHRLHGGVRRLQSHPAIRFAEELLDGR